MAAETTPAPARETIAAKLETLLRTRGVDVRRAFGTLSIKGSQLVEVVVDDDSIVVASASWRWHEGLPKGLTYAQIADCVAQRANGKGQQLGQVTVATGSTYRVIPAPAA